MTTSSSKTDNLFQAFGIFIEAMRPFIVSVLQKEAGDQWPKWFVESLYQSQKDAWNQGIESGSLPETLVDFQHLKPFSLKYKDLLKPDFGRDMNKAATWFETIYEVRNKIAHFQEITVDERTEAFLHMKSVSKILQMTDLSEELERLQEGSIRISKPTDIKKHESGKPIPWFQNVQPHLDIRLGRLDESVFAANLNEVSMGGGREVYCNPVTFFSKTFLTHGLKTVARRVVKGLNGEEDAENRVISLQTGFGGGKTHTLISLYHLCNWGMRASESIYNSELLSYTGKPNFDKVNIGIFTNHTNDPANGRITKEGLHLQTIWGDLAYQLGGPKAYEIVKKNDEQLIAPGGLFQKVFELCKPSLILIDELADYCLKASGRVVGSSSLADQTISFMQELTEAISLTNHCVAVITLPASPQEVGNTPQAQNILISLQKRVTRVGADTQPVADEEVYEVIRRRLFEEVGDELSITTVADQYMDMYRKCGQDLPSQASMLEYRNRLIKSYPFHPELIDIFRVRWAGHHDFQRTRGALRLLAAIVSEMWQRRQSLPGPNLLIQTGDMNLTKLDAVTAQLKKLYGNGYDAVISADVSGSQSNAFILDSKKTEYGIWYLTQGIATTILLNSFGSDGSNQGISIPEIKLHLLKPETFNHNLIDSSINELSDHAHFLYQATGVKGKRYWFHTKPNLNILINAIKGDIQNQVDSEIIRRINEKVRQVQGFHVIVNPTDEIPEQTKPTLVVLGPSYLANPDKINGNTKILIQRLATKKGNSERLYRNTLLFLICSEFGISKLTNDIAEYLASQKIQRDYHSQLDDGQRTEIKQRMEEASRQSDTSIIKGYSIVVKNSVKSGLQRIQLQQFQPSLDQQINSTLIQALRNEEWMLFESVGLSTFRKHNLLPAPASVIQVKEIYEAFLRFDDKPMILGSRTVAESLLRYCLSGDINIATGDGENFTTYYVKKEVPLFDVTDPIYWLVSDGRLPVQQPPENPPIGPGQPPGGEPQVPPLPPGPGPVEPPPTRVIKAISVSGKVPLEQYTDLFQYFISPFAMTGNKLDIEVKFTIKSTEANPLDETKPQYKNAKEAAKQLGLEFGEE